MWVVGIVKRWEDCLQSFLPVGPDKAAAPSEWGLGFCPVFETKEEAEKFYPDAPLKEVRPKE